MTLPVIGITVDTEQPGGYSKFPWYALRENYASAVTRAGGVPIFVAYCYLADLGAVYDRRLTSGHTLTFALSGYTYSDFTGNLSVIASMDFDSDAEANALAVGGSDRVGLLPVGAIITSRLPMAPIRVSGRIMSRSAR